MEGYVMRTLTSYSDTEKIEMFDNLYIQCLEEINEAVESEEHDKHHFWEGTIADVLGMDEADWDIHNKGVLLGAENNEEIMKKNYGLYVKEYIDTDRDVSKMLNFAQWEELQPKG